MTIKVDKSYIDLVIEDLYGSIGISESISCIKEKTMIEEGNIVDAITSISNYMGLPIKYYLEYVSENYSYKDKNSPLFSSDDLVKRDESGKSSSGIVAQVMLPNYFPPYGSSSLKYYPIKVRISEESLKYPYTLITLLIHEISHVLLKSLYHKEMKNEVYVDITGMMVGFADVIKIGRKTESETISEKIRNTETTTYGYLDDDIFNYACKIIHDKLISQTSVKSNAIDKINKLENLMALSERSICKYDKYLSYIRNHAYREFDCNDSKTIVDLYSRDYTSKLRSDVNYKKEKIMHIKNDINRINKYNPKVVGLINSNIVSISELTIYIEQQLNELLGYIKMLEKYVGVLFRIKSIF